MARLFATGWEPGHIGVMDLAPNGTVVTTPTAGSWSGYAHNGGTGASPSTRSLPAASEIYFGCRIYIGLIVSWTAGSRIIGFSSSSAEQCLLAETAGGKFQVRNGDGTLLTGGTGTKQLVANTWYYVEGHIIVSETVGVFELKVDGVQDINVTGADTRNDAGTANIDRVNFTSKDNRVYDDFYVNDTTGAQNTGYAGDTRVEWRPPNATGDIAGFTPTSGANWTNVDERPPNDATDIVAATGTTLYDLYNMADLSASAVQSVTLWARAQKSDAGAKSIAHMLKSGATENQGADVALSTGWTFYPKVYSNDPTDSAAWSVSKFNALQIGQKAR